MIYEDLIYLWLAFIVYEFIPVTSYEIPFLFSLFLIKEFLFIFFLLIVRKKVYQSKFDIVPILEKIFIAFVFIFYLIDLSFFKLKIYLDRIYFSSLLGILWFLHYMFLVKFLLLRVSLNYLRILFGIIFPIIMLVVLQDIFDMLGMTFQGDIFLFLILVIFISPFLMVKIWPVKPMENSELEKSILDFFKKNKVKITQIYVLNNLGKKVYTAGILGFLSPFKYLFFSKPILNILSKKEILGVVAHEIGHLKKRHNLWLLLVLINLPLYLLTFSVLVVLIINYFYPELIQFIENKESLPFSVEAFWGIALIFLSFIYIRYIFSFFLRQFEREADFYSAIILKTPQPLISALFKIGQITGQLYKKSWHHYGIFERIEFLNEMFSNVEKSKNIKKKFIKIRLILMLWIFFNLMISLIVLNIEEIVKGVSWLFS